MEKVILQDQVGNKVAELEISSNKEGLVSGTIIKNLFRPDQKKEFKEFEELANNQIFSLLDEAAARIEMNGYKIKSKDWRIYDIQIFEGTNISFRIK